MRLSVRATLPVLAACALLFACGGPQGTATGLGPTTPTGSAGNPGGATPQGGGVNPVTDGGTSQVADAGGGGFGTLAVQVVGSGSVISHPAGISCSNACTGQFQSGTTVSLVASPASGFIFAGWSGACFGTGSCTIAVVTNENNNNNNTTAVATFVSR